MHRKHECPHEPLTCRLAYRIGQHEGNGFFWTKRDRQLLLEAWKRIEQLETELHRRPRSPEL